MLTRFIFRALCTLLIGILLVCNPMGMTVLLVQLIGGLFILSGIVAIIGYFINKQQARQAKRRADAALQRPVEDVGGSQLATDETTGVRADAGAKQHTSLLTPVFPVVGIGSLAFGVFLLSFPAQFVTYLMYTLGALLVLIGVMQVVQFIRLRQYAPLTWSLFLFPLLIIVAGVFVFVYPIETASVPFLIIGIGYMIYGISEFFFGVRFHHFLRLFKAEQQRLHQWSESAVDAEAEEITENEEVADAGARTFTQSSR